MNYDFRVWSEFYRYFSHDYYTRLGRDWNQKRKVSTVRVRVSIAISTYHKEHTEKGRENSFILIISHIRITHITQHTHTHESISVQGSSRFPIIVITSFYGSCSYVC